MNNNILGNRGLFFEWTTPKWMPIPIWRNWNKWKYSPRGKSKSSWRKIWNKIYHCSWYRRFCFQCRAQWTKIFHDAKIGKTPYNASFQYVLGNDGYYHNIPDDEAAYYAGDGILTIVDLAGSESVHNSTISLFREFQVGVYGTQEKPHVNISIDGYYTIDDKKCIVHLQMKKEIF